jgi:histone deacetylase 11
MPHSSVLLLAAVVIAVVYYNNFHNLTERNIESVPVPKQCTMCDTNTFATNITTRGIILYRDQMNVRILGVQRFHPFDSEKYGNIFTFLRNEIPHLPYVRPKAVTFEQLSQIHTNEYITRIQSDPSLIAQVAQMEMISWLPNFVLQRTFILPMRYAVGATIAAGELVSSETEFKAAIVLGGGFHHAHSTIGGGWCFFSDVILSIMNVSKKKGENVLYIDLDAHTGNGVARDKKLLKKTMPNVNIYIIDMFNAQIYPGDHYAEKSINQAVYLKPLTSDTDYLKALARELKRSETEFPLPNVIYYNAGSDILVGDPLGWLNVSNEGLIKRDEMVFSFANKLNRPIIMVLSGGYQRTNAKVISDSIINLNNKFSLFG